MNRFCPTAKYILKTDDDVYADIFQVVDVVLVELINSRKTYACENMAGNKPDRRKNSKWHVPEEVFKEESYPAFCSGSAYLVRTDDASKIYSISNKTTFLWVDDAFVTGVLRENYDLIVSNRSESSLQIMTLYNRHHLGKKTETISWCSEGLGSRPMKYTFMLLDKKDFIRDMFCIWNKIRLLRYAMNNVIEHDCED